MRPGAARVESNLLILVTLALVAFGLVMVYSATSAAAAVSNGDPAYYLKRQALYTGVGVVAMMLASRVDFRALRRMSAGLVLASLVLLLGVLAVGHTVNGARRWIDVGPVQFQPSELAKVAIAVWAAAYLSRRKPPRTLKQLARPLGLLVGVVCVLLLAEPDMGTAIAIVVMVAAMLLVAGTPPRALAAGVGIFTAIGVAAVWFEPYRRARIFSFVNPWHDAQGAGFQTVQAMIGLGSGGLFGAGLGQSVQKLFYLPEAHTDMIFAIIGEELGLFGSLLVIAAYTAFALAGLRIALRCRDPFGKRLAAGLTVLVCGQAAINLAAVMGLAPLTGIPLPFVSYGGSSIVVALASVGVLLNIATTDAGQSRGRVREPERTVRTVAAERPTRRAESRRAARSS